MENRIPVYQPLFGGNEKKYVMDCLETTWISSKGKYIGLFEKEFAERIGIKYAATVANGTVAIHLALVALGIGTGNEVIAPTFTYIASINAITYTGAKPVFADSLKDTWQIDPNDVRKKITSKTKAIMAVHLYGHPCDMDALSSICKEFNIFLIEDCAEAFGALYKGKHVGTFGDIASFSFFGNKTITTGEGGMVVTNNSHLHERTVHYKGQGLVKNSLYWHDVIGYNYRMTNICAAIGLAQLEQANSFIDKKIQVAEWYKEALKGTGLDHHRQVGDVRHSYWMFSILVNQSSDRDKLRQSLDRRGIETRPLFFPIHTMPMYSTGSQNHEVAEYLGSHGINLPSYPELAKGEVEFISDCIKEYFD